MSKKHFIKGTLILACTGFLSRFMGFFYRIFLSHTIGAHGLGIFQLVLPLHALVMALSASGIQTAISRLAASHTALGQKKEARDYFFAGTVFSVGLSAAVSWFIHSNAAFFAKEILKEPLTLPLIRMFVFSFPLSALHTCINSYYLALKRTEIPAGIQLFEQLVRVGSCYLIYLIFVSEGREITPLIAVGGTLASEAASSFVSVFFIGISFRKAHYFPSKIRQPFAVLRNLFHISIPLTLNRILLTLLNSMEVILIPQRLRLYGLTPTETLSVYGIFTGMALPLILFPATVTNSAAAMLMPSIAELQALGYKKRIQYVTRKILRYCLLFGGLCTILFLLFGRFLGDFLFHSPTAGTYIRTLAFICPFLYLNTTFTSVLNGLGKSGLCLLHSVLGISVRVIFVFFAIPVLGIRGYLYGILLGELLLTLLHINAVFRLNIQT